MKKYFQTSMSALAVSTMVMGGVMTAVSIPASPAFSQGNSAGNRNENSSRGGRDNRGDRDNRGGRDNNNNNRSAAASSLGALNAAHANANALANSSTNSRVGMIAVYKLAVEATAEAGATLDAAKSTLNTFIVKCGSETTEFSLTAEECQGLLDAATDSAQLAAEEGVVVPSFKYESYVASLEQTVSDADTAQTDAKVLEDMALQAAANKVTNDEVIAALWDLL